MRIRIEKTSQLAPRLFYTPSYLSHKGRLTAEDISRYYKNDTWIEGRGRDDEELERFLEWLEEKANEGKLYQKALEAAFTWLAWGYTILSAHAVKGSIYKEIKNPSDYSEKAKGFSARSQELKRRKSYSQYA